MTASSRGARFHRQARVAWAVASVLVLECAIIALAVAPAVAFWTAVYEWHVPSWARVIILAMAFVPAYLLFAVCLMLYSALAARLLGWRTPDNLTAPLADFDWPVLNWGRYLITIHVVRLFAGGVFRSTPVWVLYLKLNGARIGHGVWVNSLALMDHNLLDFGDNVVVGSDARVSGHVVERGLLKTARVTLGAGTTVGVSSIVGIGVTTGEGTQIGALSVVPKFTTLDAHASYAGAPVHKLSDA